MNRQSWMTLLGLSVASLALTGASNRGHHADDHAAHRHMMEHGKRHYTRSVEAYRIPEIALTDQEGRQVRLPSLLESSEPIALNFIFTTCTTICPVMTATFAHMRKMLGADANGLRMVSISIDPEYDTPTVLKAYAERYTAGDRWQFLTGDSDHIVEVQKAFDAYTGSKVNHRPLTFFANGDDGKWVRIDGLASGSDLASEYRRLRTK